MSLGPARAVINRLPLSAAGILAVGLALCMSAPASGAARSCDVLGGKTLAANVTLRLYRTSASHGTVLACAYATRKHVSLAINLELNDQYSYVINGHFAALVVTHLAPKDETRDGGVSYSELIMWNARTDKLTEPQPDITGVRFVTDLLSPTGVFAGLGLAYGEAFSPDAVQITPPAAQIALFDPSAKPATGPDGSPWRILATDPTSIDNLSASATTLFWTQAGDVNSAPFTAATQ
jgi:hypothetical protein